MTAFEWAGAALRATMELPSRVLDAPIPMLLWCPRCGAPHIDNARIPFRRMLMSHLIADTRAELLAMMDRTGVQRRWIQAAGTDREHFDVCAEKREAAIAAGAVAVNGRGLIDVVRRKRAAREARTG